MSGTRTDLHADIVIIGGGSAGSLLAARLSEDAARRVILVEAGGEPADPDIWNPAAWPALQGRSYDWNYVTQPQAGTAGRSHHWARGRLIGGSSCLHAMGYMRGHPSDFEAWADAAGDRRWTWDGLLPAFRAIEDHPLGGDGVHGKGGPMPVFMPDAEVSPLAQAFIAAGAALGLPRIPGHNSGRMIGVTPNSLNIRDAKRVSAASAWLTAPVRKRENLTIMTDVQVHRLVFERDRALGVEAVGPSGQMRMTGDRIVLCAGAIESPALLMRSGIGPRPVLEDAGVDCLIDMQDVGRHLQDHLLGAGNLYAARRHVPPSRLQHSESMAYMRASDFSGAGRPDIVVGCGVAPIVSERFAAPAAGTAYSLLFGVTHPTSRGSIRISGPNPGDRLAIDPAYLQTRSDRDLFRQALEAARAIGARQELADWRERELLPGPLGSAAEIDAFIAEAAITHHHPCGTCRMGSDADAVVDPDLRLKPLDNLYVVDASVIPRITSGPIHAAVLAIAEAFAQQLDGAAPAETLTSRPA